MISREQATQWVKLLRRHIIGITGLPINVVLTRREATAATDGRRLVLFNPRPFEAGKPEIGLGIGTHESGHLVFSSNCGEIMKRADKEGGKPLTIIVNLLLDRKDDTLMRKHFPGAARYLNARLPWVCPKVDKKEREENPYTDFFYVCKAGARPLHTANWQTLSLIKRYMPRLNSVSPDAILQCGKEILELIGSSMPEDRTQEMIDILISLFEKFEENEAGASNLDEDELELLNAVIQAVEEEEALNRLPHKGVDHPDIPGNPLGQVGRPPDMPEEIDVGPDASSFGDALQEVLHLAGPLRQHLERLAIRDFEIVRGLEEGDVDTTQLARIALGHSDVYSVQRQADSSFTIALALDCSTSMQHSLGGRPKSQRANQLGALFNSALEQLPGTTSNCWAYGREIFNCGPASLDSGIAGIKLQPANCDSYMAARLVEYFNANPADTMVAVFLADGGPDSFKDLKEWVEVLQQMGVLVVQFYLESRESPAELVSIYDYQVKFDGDSVDHMVDDFCELLKRLYGG